MEDKQNQRRGLFGLGFGNGNMTMWIIVILVVVLGLWLAKDYIMPKEQVQIGGLYSPSMIELSQMTIEQGL